MRLVRATSLFVFLFHFGLGCSGPSGPELEGFWAGGITGAHCPPASVPYGGCDGDDCGVACVADTICKPTAPDCPNGYLCEPSEEEGDAYCMPAATCTEPSDCPEGQHCGDKDISVGICITLDGVPSTCSKHSDCDWAFDCIEGECKLPCYESAACPAEMICGEGHHCEPG